jgi:hypothetical protein
MPPQKRKKRRGEEAAGEEEEKEEEEERALFRKQPNLRCLISQIREHVDSHRGMTNVFLNRLAQTATSLITPREGRGKEEESLPFMGTFSADCIPKRKLLRMDAFSIIVNLKRRSPKRTPEQREGKRQLLTDLDYLVTGHFVVVAAFSDFTFYVDSFGKRCRQEDVQDFLRMRRNPVYRNESKLQAAQSTYCGLFCLLFVLYFYQRPKWRLKFDERGDLQRNEKLCLNFLNKLLSA